MMMLLDSLKMLPLFLVMAVVSYAMAEHEHREGIDRVMTVEDLARAMAGGGLQGNPSPDHTQKPIAAEEACESEECNQLEKGSEEVEVPEPVAYEDITGTISILKPENGSIIEGGLFEVELNIETNTEETQEFVKKYNDTTVCMSLDNSSYSCWPLFGLSRFPRYVEVSPGSHTLVAKLVDPETASNSVVNQGDGVHFNADFLEFSMGTTTFTTIPLNQTKEDERKRKTMEEMEKKQANSSESEMEEDSGPQTIAIPLVSVDYPSEGSAVRSTFESRLNIQTTANITRFKNLFQHSFMCLAMDDDPYTCWPIFEERYYPRFSNCEPGMHRLTAKLSHPEDGSIIKGSGVGYTRFWVSGKDQGIVVPMKLTPVDEVSGGSTALSKEYTDTAKSNAAEEVMETQQVDNVAAAVEPMNQVQAQEPEGDTETKEQQKPDFTAAADTTISHVVVQVLVDGFDHSIPIYEGDDFYKEASRFCRINNIQGQQCPESITAHIQEEWAKHKTRISFSSS